MFLDVVCNSSSRGSLVEFKEICLSRIEHIAGQLFDLSSSRTVCLECLELAILELK